MQEHAHSLAGAPLPAVRTLSCPPTGTVTLAIDPAAPLIESVEAHLHADDVLRARVSGCTLRLELGSRAPDPVALRSLGRVLREVHGCTLIAVDCDEEALRRFAEQQLHLVVHLTEPLLTESQLTESQPADVPAVVPPPLPVSVTVVDQLAADSDLTADSDVAGDAELEVPDFDDSDEDPDADWGDEDLPETGHDPAQPEPSEALPSEELPSEDLPSEDLPSGSPETVSAEAAALPAETAEETVEEAAEETAEETAEEAVEAAGQAETAAAAAPPEETVASPDPTDAADPAELPEAAESTDLLTAPEQPPAADPSDAPTDPGMAVPESPASPRAAATPPALPEAPSPEADAEARPLPQGWNPEGRGRVTAVRRTLRSGNRVRAAGDLVIYGDVNAGAQVEATGNVIVLGALRGLAHAGVNGETEAVVLALELDRGQVRIADQISFEAGAPTDDPSRRGRLRLLLGRGAPPPAPRSGPTLLRLDGDHIVTEPWRGRLPDLSAR